VKLNHRLGILAWSLALTGCLGGLLPKAEERAVFALPAPVKMSSRALPAALLVETPRAIAPLGGPDIMVVRADGEVQILAGVRWAAPLPMLLQDLLARQIEMAGGAPSVAQSAQSYRMPLRLASDLRAFEAWVDGNAMSVHAELTAHLICTQDARILASSAPINIMMADLPNTATAATAALRDSASRLAREVTLWLSGVDAGGCDLD